MELKGKRVLFLGDSITEGVGASRVENRYTDVFGRLSGCEIFNYGISGTRIARKHKKSPDPKTDYCFLDRVEEMEPSCDVVVVFGGTNDFGHGDGGLGVFTDNDEYTFYGAMHSLIRRIINKYPDALLVFMTPLHRTSEAVTVNEIGISCEPLYEYVKAQRQVCEYYSVPVLDLYATSGMQPSIRIIKERYMPDGLHPSDLGAEIIAKRLYSFLINI